MSSAVTPSVTLIGLFATLPSAILTLTASPRTTGYLVQRPVLPRWRGGGAPARGNPPLAVVLSRTQHARVRDIAGAGLEHKKRNFHVAVQSADSHEAGGVPRQAPAIHGK